MHTTVLPFQMKLQGTETSRKKSIWHSWHFSITELKWQQKSKKTGPENLQVITFKTRTLLVKLIFNGNFEKPQNSCPLHKDNIFLNHCFDREVKKSLSHQSCAMFWSSGLHHFHHWFNLRSGGKHTVFSSVKVVSDCFPLPVSEPPCPSVILQEISVLLAIILHRVQRAGYYG